MRIYESFSSGLISLLGSTAFDLLLVGQHRFQRSEPVVSRLPAFNFALFKPLLDRSRTYSRLSRCLSNGDPLLIAGHRTPKNWEYPGIILSDSLFLN